MARRPGFTLVELLIVMAVLAVLLAVLMPAIAGLRASALKVVCASRLRDLTLASQSYMLRERSYPLQPGTSARAGGLPVGLPGPLVGVLPPRPNDMEPAFLNALR